MVLLQLLSALLLVQVFFSQITVDHDLSLEMAAGVRGSQAVGMSLLVPTGY